MCATYHFKTLLSINFILNVNDLFLFFFSKINSFKKVKGRLKEEVNLDQVLWYRERETQDLEEIKNEAITAPRDGFPFNNLRSNNKRGGD